MDKLDNMDGVDIVEEKKINGDIEKIEEINKEEIIEKVKKDGSLNCLSISERNYIFFSDDLTRKIRNLVERSEERKKRDQIYMNITGDLTEVWREKMDNAMFIMAVDFEVNLQLGKDGLIQKPEKKEIESDKKARKPSKKMVLNLIKVFEGKNLLSKEDTIYGLRDFGYTAEDITLNLYIRWATEWGILNQKNGEYSLNMDVVKELYGI